ncbi:MAG: hypothetical protein M0R21_03795 [Lentimicrobiaceae bacterium]|nr:hypothetical protein [Lentimicrobiaceae bacterium]
MKKWGFILAVFLSSCHYFHSGNKEDIIARAYDNYLYRSDLKGVVPKGSHPKDSVNIVKNFINNWLRQQALLNQAEANLPSDQKDFTEQLENYRNSLLVYQYETELIRQKLDTTVPFDEIKKYYQEHTADFQLRQNIILINWAQFNSGFSAIRTVKRLMLSTKESDRLKLEEFCQENALNYSVTDQNWLSPDDIERMLPVKNISREDLQKKNNFIEINDSTHFFVIAVRDFKEKESISPLDFEKRNIREIILNKRKLSLVNKMQNEVFEKARKEKDFQIY